MKRKLWILSIGIGLIVFAIVLLLRTEPKTLLADRPVKNEMAAKELSARPTKPSLPEPVPAIGSSSVVTNVAQPSGPNLSATILTAIGNGERKHFRARLEAIGQLGNNLTADERQALYEYLRDTSDEKWLRPGQAFALKNDILNRLRDQQKLPAELTDFLIALRRDTNQPLVMCDYALQHLASWYTKGPANDHDRIIRELEAAASENEKSYAGTALIGLSRIQEENFGLRIAGLEELIMRLIDESGSNLLARISAVELIGYNRLVGARDLVRRLAIDESQPQVLRIASISAIGRLGGDDETAYLRSVEKSNDERLKLAAAAALSNTK